MVYFTQLNDKKVYGRIVQQQ